MCPSGENVPVDAEVVEGKGTVDESMIDNWSCPQASTQPSEEGAG